MIVRQALELIPPKSFISGVKERLNNNNAWDLRELRNKFCIMCPSTRWIQLRIDKTKSSWTNGDWVTERAQTIIPGISRDFPGKFYFSFWKLRNVGKFHPGIAQRVWLSIWRWRKTSWRRIPERTENLWTTVVRISTKIRASENCPKSGFWIFVPYEYQLTLPIVSLCT